MSGVQSKCCISAPIKAVHLEVQFVDILTKRQQIIGTIEGQQGTIPVQLYQTSLHGLFPQQAKELLAKQLTGVSLF